MREISRRMQGEGRCLLGAWACSLALVTFATAAPDGVRQTSARAALIPITGEISGITFDSVERRLEQVRAEGMDLVIFELDTPGGALDATLDICNAIKQLRDTGVRTAAWIHDEAYSAGTIIALATDEIVMSSNATIGDCQPITVTAEGAAPIPEGLEAKALSPLLAELRDSARRNNYDLDMVMALIRPDTQVYWLENRETGERRFVSPAERDQMLAAATQPSTGDATASAWFEVRQAPGLGEITQPIKNKNELLTLRTPEAAAFGWSRAMLNTPEDVRAYFGAASVINLKQSAWETAVAWLASPMVRGILLILVLLGAYAEFHTPGIGLAGATAALALVLYLGAPYLAGFTVTWEIIAVLCGIALLSVELFVIPGFGIAGIAGILLILVGFVSSYIPAEPGFTGPHWPSLSGTYEYLTQALWSLALGTAGSLAGMAILARYLPRLPVAGRLVSKNPTRADVLPEYIDEAIARIGHLGYTESQLRPAGKARFGATLVDVVSEGDFVEKGIRVEVVDRQGSRVVVRRVD